MPPVVKSCREGSQEEGQVGSFMSSCPPPYTSELHGGIPITKSCKMLGTWEQCFSQIQPIPSLALLFLHPTLWLTYGYEWTWGAGVCQKEAGHMVRT